MSFQKYTFVIVFLQVVPNIPPEIRSNIMEMPCIDMKVGHPWIIPAKFDVIW